MKINYGTKLPPPTKLTALAFGSMEEPVLLGGGQNTSYVSGNIVLKPAGSENGSDLRAEIFKDLPESGDVRFARPIKSKAGDWIFEGYVAWSFLKGEHAKGRYAEKLKASIAFHKLLKNSKISKYTNKPKSSWGVGDMVALDEKEFKYDEEFMDLYNQIKPHLKTLLGDRQLVHGDLSGNFLFDSILPPAIIDFSAAWAPNGFAEGIMLADAIVWENASQEDIEVFKEVPNIEQMAWRGILRRITEQAEHIKRFDKEKSLALEAAQGFQKAIDYLNTNFKALV